MNAALAAAVSGYYAARPDGSPPQLRMAVEAVVVAARKGRRDCRFHYEFACDWLAGELRALGYAVRDLTTRGQTETDLLIEW